MSSKKKIRAGVIGLGVGLHQARSLFSNPKCELISICDFNKDKLTNIGSEFQNINQTQNDNDIITNPDIDLVCIASYDEFHFQQVMMCLNQNKHVYVEKPICLKKDEIKNIRKILSANPNLHLSSNMVLRTCPLFEKVREEIKLKKFEDIYYLEADYLWGRKEKIISGWRADAKFYSIIYGAAIHMVDLVYWITSKKPISVKAFGSNVIVNGTKQRHNDFAILILEYEDKMCAKISVHGAGIHPHYHALKIFGKKLSFVHDYSGTFWIDSCNLNQKFRTETAPYPEKSKRGEALTSFVDSIFDNSMLP